MQPQELRRANVAKLGIVPEHDIRELLFIQYLLVGGVFWPARNTMIWCAPLSSLPPWGRKKRGAH